jgi:hypothetical protein
VRSLALIQSCAHKGSVERYNEVPGRELPVVRLLYMPSADFRSGTYALPSDAVQVPWTPPADLMLPRSVFLPHRLPSPTPSYSEATDTQGQADFDDIMVHVVVSHLEARHQRYHFDVMAEDGLPVAVRCDLLYAQMLAEVPRFLLSASSYFSASPSDVCSGQPGCNALLHTVSIRCRFPWNFLCAASLQAKAALRSEPLPRGYPNRNTPCVCCDVLDYAPLAFSSTQQFNDDAPLRCICWFWN